MKLNNLKRCFVIAEISANHGQNFKKTVEMIKKVKECGADAVKVQTYTPDTLTIDVDNKYFRINHPRWGNQTLYQLYKKGQIPWKWTKQLKKEAEKLGLVFFSTAYDKTSIDFLEDIGVEIHKIASFELVDIPLVEYAAKTHKPLILSTGMATLSEINEAVLVAKKAGAKDIALLKCISGYPADPACMNLRTIPDMRKKFKLPVGLSDHTLGIGVSIAAVSMGAQIIERHFTLSRKAKTPDSFFSLEPQEFKDLVCNLREAEAAIGKVYYGLTKSEKKSYVFRRSLFAVKDICRGEMFTEDNVRSIRPANGIKPKYLGKIIGRKTKCNIKKGMPIKQRHIT